MLRSLLLVLLLAFSACHSADDLGPGSAESYCGVVVGSDEPEPGCEGVNCSFIRRGFPPATRLRLSFSPALANCPAESAPADWAGVLSSSDGSFACTFFHEIQPLQHDLLSEYDFPGADRIRNHIFTARPAAGALQGRDVMLFASLLGTEKMELRVIVGAGDERAGDYFGLFPLNAEQEDCP